MRRRTIAVAIIAIAVVMIAVGLLSSLLVNWLWFSSVGYFAVFRTIVVAKTVVFLFVLVASGLCFWVSGAVALRYARRQSPWHSIAFPQGTGSEQALPDLVASLASRSTWSYLIVAASLVLAFLTATGEFGDWSLALRFIDRVPYGETDPVFGRDIGFYLFALPAYVALTQWLYATLFLSALVAGVVYWLHGDFSFDVAPWQLSPAILVHGSVLLGLFFALKAWSYDLDRYRLLYSDNGVVVGAAYTDIHVNLPILWLLIGLTLGAALASWLNIRWQTYWIPGTAIAAFLGVLALSLVVPSLFERFYVKPNELALETPYLRPNIALTQEAYNLRHVIVRPFPVEQNLTLRSLDADRGTIDNVRLWDERPLMDTYAQLQEIRTYYRYYRVNVDRYELGSSYQQVMLSAREIDASLLSQSAQTWVNLHLLFTHGNGVVMSPVTQKTAEGLPIFYESDVPPVASGGPAVLQPRIYFGEGSLPYVIVKTAMPEFDYPKGSNNAYTTYDGSAGVVVGSLARRSLFAWHFGDPNILISSYLTPESRILFHRDVQDRIRSIAPFLSLDHNPYVVVSGGRLYWIQDAYTTSSWFPYSPPAPGTDINYIRNSVKIIVDAYNGSIDFYELDPNDPMLAAYRRIFPGLFKPLNAMPADLRKHIRYPQDLLQIQAEMYRAYHMSAPEVFYNREDLWQFPRQTSSVGGVEAAGNTPMMPYYMIMRLPEEAKPAFFLMVPMVPNRRENMIAWLAAGCDPPDYGKLIVYEFPKEKQVYGPFQIEARINQNTEISQQISLWNQMGSRVIRGNVLVIPVEHSILYVSPLYLRAETGQLPELKRVIAAYGDRVVMADTLPQALAALFQAAPAPATPVVATAGPSVASAPPSGNLAAEALDDYDRALERLKAGDWSGFGAKLDALRPLLQSLSRGQAEH
ncbi:MAG TPA: UPF0182 family protein [Stellaceae bacterium]|nr:UPF0182 family protein [Stellaceae bacterium]